MEKISDRDKFSKNSVSLTCMLIKITIRKQKGTETNLYKAYFESKLTENIEKPKELWKSLKSLGLKYERSISNINCLENDKSTSFDVKVIAKDFSVYFSNLAENLVVKLPNPSYNKYGVLSVAQYHRHLGLTKNLICYQQKKIMHLRF